MLGAVVHQIPVQPRGEVLHVEHHEIAGQQVEADGVGGQERDTHPGDHRLLDGLGARDLHRDVEFPKLPSEHLAHRVPGIGSGLAHHEALAIERRAWNLPRPGKRMTRRRHDHIGMGRERYRDDVHVGGRTDHHREIGEIVGELAQQAVAIVDREVERDPGMLGAEGRQHPRKEVVAGADDRDVELPAGDALEIRERGVRLPHALGDRAGALEHLPAGRRQEGPATDPLEERQARLRRQLLENRRHCRLRQVQLVRGAGEIHVARRGGEHPQLPQGHIAHRDLRSQPSRGIMEYLCSR